MQSEDALQTQCVQWFHNTYPNLRGLLFSVPNGGKRTPTEARRLKYTGLTPGIPDLIFAYHGEATFIELKTLTGTLSQEQIGIHGLLRKEAFKVHVARSLDEFKSVITSLI